MFRMRGKTQLIMLVMSVMTVIFILYRMTAGDNQMHAVEKNSKFPWSPQKELIFGSRIEMEDINELSDLTQSPRHILKQKAVESQLMSDIRKVNTPQFKHQFSSGRSVLGGNGHEGNSDNAVNAEELAERSGVHNLGPHRIVHLDLKGAPPLVSYFEGLFPLLQSLGTTGLLIEYEDMFPFWGPLAGLAARNAYSKANVTRILSLARDNRLDVIPLIQTFGHLEFVLKLRTHKHLREVPRYPQAICPTHEESFPLLKTMIDQVMELHPEARNIHLGADEVYQLGECDRCRAAMQADNITPKRLFLNHVSKVAEYTKDKYKVNVLIWDDGLRSNSIEELTASGLGGKGVQPVIWKYTPDVAASLPADVWERLSSSGFSTVWVATAFKGATGPDKYVTDISHHLENHRSWAAVVASAKAGSSGLALGGPKPFPHIAGTILTGWQRYDHFAVLCELLPVGLPSLAVSLTFLKTGENNVAMLRRQASDALRCEMPLAMTPSEILELGSLSSAPRCVFPGAGVLHVAERLHALKADVERVAAMPEAKGWATKYNVDHKFSSPFHIEQFSREVDGLRGHMAVLEREARLALSEVYDSSTVEEWVSSVMGPLFNRVREMWDGKEALLAVEEWPLRPLDGTIEKDL
ncbi:hexosaminidase D-like [Ischnura elegans]|uniref:hexosaminidase D-like n=1 Tax=Ischnura elegans TaxID=197161 RepID=UPI001ED8A50A|nr:hexosaminidase D-like [Ischnura elegans]XP_046382431.1 hexosaminidase D-like [Ischnura elegans]